MRTESPLYIAVADEGDGCNGCAFAGRDGLGQCTTHACDPLAWPDDHHLSLAQNIIWVRPQ